MASPHEPPEEPHLARSAGSTGSAIRPRLKALGLLTLVVLAAAVFAGVSSAMAESTQLCKADEATCAGGNVITHVHEETLSGTKAKLLAGRTGTVECDALFLGDSLGLGTPLVIHGNFTYTNCRLGGTNCTVTEESGGSLIQVLKLGHETADVTGEGEVRVRCGIFINCLYSSEGLVGTAKGPLLSSFETGDVTISEQTVNRISGLCPSTGKLDISTMPLSATYLAGGGEKLSATPTSLTTSLKGGGKEGAEITVTEGTKVKDTATLSGENASKATGTIKYAVYKDKECKELVTKAGEGEVKEGKVPDSEEKELEAATVYYWQAEYSGDEMNEKSTSTCSKEVLTVKAKTSLTTKLSGGGKEGEEITVAEGSKVKDTATLSGTKASTATGTVHYSVYSDEECKELAAEAGEVSVEGGKAPASEGVKLEAGDIYYWQAKYSGDSTHESSTSACGTEIEVVAENTTLTTLLLAVDEGEEVEQGEEIEVEEGITIFDSATLSGASAAEATGVVRYFVYSDEECKELAAEAGEVSVEGEEVPLSSAVVMPAGTYYWQARYYGDSFNKGSTSSCGDEILTITEPAITTSLSGEEQSGEEIEVTEEAAVTDTATLHGANASKATGTVEYFVYSDEECKELAAEAGEVSVEGASVPASAKVKLPTGTYYWQAVYSGDEENPPATSVCGTEVEVVAEAISITTSLSGEEQSGEEIEVQEVAAVTDSATLSGKNASKATGTVAYDVYADNRCEDLVANAGSVSVESGEVPVSEEVKLTAGTYYWQARYFGDAANKSSMSACGSEIEKVALAPITTSLTGDEGQSGSEIEVNETTLVTDSATLNMEGASTATGTVTYFVYSDRECKELVTKAGEVEVKEGRVPNSEKKKFASGTYYWQAEYSGDLEHEEATSICGTEVQNVLDPWVVSVGDSFIGGEGGRWAGNVDSNRSGARDSELIDALGPNAYKSTLNRESTGEAIPGCRRSHSAEVFIRLAPLGTTWIDGRNFACSGSETKSRSSGGFFKPGLDFIDVPAGGELAPGSIPARGNCPLAAPAKCKGQAKLLEEFARVRFNNGEKINMIALSIGGNNFGFGDVVRACAEAFEAPNWRRPCNELHAARFEPVPAGMVRGEIETGIINIGDAMKNAGFNAREFTILVQDYPSPIPSERQFRYVGNGRSIANGGGCPFLNVDANWANATAIDVINKTVKDAVTNVGLNTSYRVTFMELKNAFVRRRLCEERVTLVRDGTSAALRSWRVPTAVDESEWVNQIRNIGGDFDIRESVHPNFWGQLALRNCLRQMYNNGTPLASKECVIDAPGLLAAPNGRRDWLREPRMKLN